MLSVLERRSLRRKSDDEVAKAQGERVSIALLAMHTSILRLQHGASA
jgi:hypothetical protein